MATLRSARGSDVLMLLAAVGVPLAAYLVTLHPGLPAGDSGELITAVATGGSAHPPGYPLYMLLGGIATRLLPGASPAWALNLFSALCAALAAGVLAVAVLRLGGSRIAAVAAAWALGLSVPLWRNAVVAEVFALHALLTALLLLAAVHAAPAPARALPWLALLTALALSHHHTLLLLAAPVLLVTAVRAWRAGDLRGGTALRTLAAGLAGLAPLAWLPLAARRADALVWGDATTPRGFLSLLTRAEYGSLSLAPLEAGLTAGRSHMLVFAEALPAAFGVGMLVVALAGATELGRRHRALVPALLLFVAAQAWFFSRIEFPADVPLYRGVVERFYILPLAVLALLTGLGVARLLAMVPAAPRGARAAAAALALALMLLPAAAHLRRLDQRGNTLVATVGQAILASAPPGAVLFVQGDVLHNALAYLTRIERLRPDVTVLDQELMTYLWYVRRVRAAHPALLPDFRRAERITLRDGRGLEGVAIERADGTIDLLVEQGNATVGGGEVARHVPAPSESLYQATRRGYRRSPWLESGDDRYSGLPGSRSLLWLDHLAGRRPVAMIGTKDDAWALRYALTPVGLAARAHPRADPLPVAAQAAAALAVLEAVPFDDYFRAQDATSFEAAERARLADAVARTALLMCQPGVDPARAAHPEGHARLLAFAARFEALDPTPDPVVLRSLGFLRLFDPGARDLAAARRDFERYQQSGAHAAADAEVRRALEQLAGLAR